MNEGELLTLLDDVLEGHRMTEEEAVSLMKIRDRNIFRVAEAADELRERKVGNFVTYVRNHNLHVTNICKNLCGFCGFGRPKKAEDAYLHDEEEIRRRALLAKERNVTEICLLSGVHPDFDAERYAEIISWVHDVVPDADIHTMSPDEISYSAKKSGISTKEVIEMVRSAGLGTLQGTAAEILVDSVRKTICPAKVPTDEWVRIIKEAHSLGIKSTATILPGSVETEADRVEHLRVLREIQDETGGFTELVPLPYLHLNTPLFDKGLAPAGATGRTDILLFAVSRLYLDNFDNIQISWGKLGKKFTQMGLLSGGNDFGGTMFSDEVSVEAGGEGSDFLDPEEMRRMTEDIGRVLKQRSTTYEILN